MALLPIFVEVQSRPVLVVGGGEVAQRKVEALVEAGARVTVISPRLTPRLAQLAARGTIRHLARRYQPGDLTGFTLVYGATDDPGVHRQLAVEARSRGAMLNLADQPHLCDFIVPAVVRRGELVVAISTGGSSPALASRLRRQFETILGPEYELLLAIMQEARKRLHASTENRLSRMDALNSLAASGLEEPLRRRDFAQADRLLVEHLGENFSLAELGFTAQRLNSYFESSELAR